MKIICRKPSGTNCNANEKKFPIDPKIFLPLPLVSVKETSETPFEKSARPRKYLSPAGTYPRSLSGLRLGARRRGKGAQPAQNQNENSCRYLAHFLSPSVCQTEFNSHARRKIHSLTFPFCGLELDLLRRASCRFIETMAQTAYHPVYLNAAVCQEYHLKDNVAFYS